MKQNTNPNEIYCMSQEQKILYYMLRGNRITPLEAMQRFQCERLAARIADIRKKGFDVQSEYVATPSGKRVKSYWITPKY